MSLVCGVRKEFIPQQYIEKAQDAVMTLSARGTIEQIAAKIAAAELGQILFFATQTILYALAFYSVIPIPIAGALGFALLPFATLCSYYTFIHYKMFARILLTIAAIFTLAVCAGIATSGAISDSAITLCAGGIALHLFRNISDCVDTRNSQKDEKYQKTRKEVLNVVYRDTSGTTE